MRLIGCALLSALFLAGCGFTWDIPGPKVARAETPASHDDNHCFAMERDRPRCEAR